MLRYVSVILGYLLVLPLLIAQQADRPQIGLVLSGGGAKGICHVGVLKVLEEEGIRPDLIAGTSMGSLVGGLYACGYGAADIERILLDIDWDQLMTNKVRLDQIAIEEKRFYERWLVELPYDNGIKLPSGLIRGQKIQELIRHHTLPYHGTEDFSQLPIPFLCIATDVATGEAVVQDHGFLPEAMRASMSIPTAFTPIVRDSMILVDGGEIRNLPVSDARDRGMDLVIGVDIGDGLLPASKLTSAVDILTQSAMFASLKDTERQRALCDVLILPDYAPYSTGSFVAEAVPYLITKGYEAADALRPQIREIARQAGFTPGTYTPLAPALPDTLQLERIEVRNSAGLVNDLVTSRFKEDHGKLALKDLEERISLLYGMRHFDLVQYRLLPEGAGHTLIVEATPSAPGRIALSLNFDTYHQASVGALLMIYDKLLPASRFTAEGYVGRYPSIELGYLKYVGRKRRFALELDGYYEQGPAYTRDEQGRAEGEFLQTVQGGFLRFRSTASRAFSAGLQLQPRTLAQRPSVLSVLNLGSDEDPVLIDLADIDRIQSSWISAGAFMTFNNMDHVLYPHRGWNIQVDLSTYQEAVTELRFTEQYLADLDPSLAEFLSDYASDLSTYDEFVRGTIEWSGRIPVTPRGTIIMDGALSLSNEAGLLGGDPITLGGFRRPDRTSTGFWGLKEFDAAVVDLALLRGGIQWRLWKNVHWQAAANGAWTGFLHDDTYLILEEKFVLGYGTTIGLKGPFGLIQLGVASNTANEQVLGWFNLGFRI